MIDALFLIGIGVLSRLLPHPANFTAVGGLALFSGAQYGLWKAVLITIGTIVLSDTILGFHAVMWATYGSFLLGVGLGKMLTKNIRIEKIIGLTLLSSVLFFLITNFAVWALPESIYPKTPAGLIACYIAALPFFRNSLAGDLFYTSAFFGVSEVATLLKRRYQLEKASQR